MMTFFHDQVFFYTDIPLLLILIGVECLLSADNAFIIAMMVKALPKKDRYKALWSGFISAIFFRCIAILLASYLIRYIAFQALGGLYLIYLGMKEVLSSKKKSKPKADQSPLFKKILWIELTNLAFSLDAIIAAFAIVGITPFDNDATSRLWIVYVGGLIGLFMMRAASSSVVYLLEKHPFLDKICYSLIVWIGTRLIVESCLSFIHIHLNINMTIPHHIFAYIFWSGIGFLILYATTCFLSKRHRRLQ